MVREIAVHLDIGHHAVQEVIATLGYREVCSHWGPHLLTEEHKNTCMDVSSQLLQRHSAEDVAFLFRIVTGDGIWFHHFDSEIEQQRMEWHHSTSPKNKKAK